MTESKIMKAFELCFAEKGSIYTCGVCPYHKFGELCKVERDKDALDLINRKNAEISEKDAEIEALQAENKDIVIIRGEGGKIVEKGHIVYLTVEQIEQRERAEAIKDVFQAIDFMCIDTFGNFNHKAFINLKKEMGVK